MEAIVNTKDIKTFLDKEHESSNERLQLGSAGMTKKEYIL